MSAGNQECVNFLQRCLPHLQLRWLGFRKVRGTVCKRLKRRMVELGIADFEAYWTYLQARPEEWERIDACCRIPISRFCRDRGIFKRLETEILPELARAARRRGSNRLNVWSLGSASGEEPYTLSILWRMALAHRFPDLSVDILGSDSDPTMIDRALTGCYAEGSLRELPPDWRNQAFDPRDSLFCVRPEFRDGVRFELADVRRTRPKGPFDLILCRNVIFTYFSAGLQVDLSQVLHDLLRPSGVLVLGQHEKLPMEAPPFFQLGRNVAIYRKCSDTTDPRLAGAAGATS